MIFRLPGQDALGALQVATNYEVGALSPKLRAFQWHSDYCMAYTHPLEYDSMTRFSMFLLPFVGQSVESMSVTINTRAFAWCNHTIFDTTRRLSRGIRHLDMKLDLDGLPGLYLTSFPWTSLHTITLSTVSLPVIRALCELPNLHRVEVDANHGTLQVPRIHLPPEPASPSLACKRPSRSPALRVLIYRSSSTSLSRTQRLAPFLASRAGLKQVRITTSAPLSPRVCQRAVDAIGSTAILRR